MGLWPCTASQLGGGHTHRPACSQLVPQEPRSEVPVAASAKGTAHVSQGTGRQAASGTGTWPLQSDLPG